MTNAWFDMYVLWISSPFLFVGLFIEPLFGPAAAWLAGGSWVWLFISTLFVLFLYFAHRDEQDKRREHDIEP